MTFPALFTVGHRVHSTAAVDGWNETTDVWADPVHKQVITYYAPSGRDPRTVGDDRIVVDLEMLVPPGFQCSPKDRMVVDGDEYEVVGPMNRLDRDPFGWNPGGLVNLRLVAAR